MAAFFELTNHLGNVHMTLSDYRRAVDQGQSVAYFSQVASASEYYPFGMLLTEGNYSSGSYRFGFQGQEMDNEIKGTGNSINFKYRMHDPRIGRFFAVDPLARKFPYWTPYAFSGNRVIDAIELEGLECVFLQVEGRGTLSSPSAPGLSGSAAVGIAINLQDGKGMIYRTYSLGVGYGAFIGGGVEVGGLFTGTIEDMKGWSVNTGASLALTALVGVPVGPEGSIEFNLTLPQLNEDNSSNSEEEKNKLGATLGIPFLSLAAGAEVHVDGSYTESLVDFDLKDIKSALEDFYNQNTEKLEETFENFDDFYENFMEGFEKAKAEYESQQDEDSDNNNSPKPQGRHDDPDRQY